MSSLIKAVGYVRCSTDMQEDSPEQQMREIKAFAQQKGYELTKWYIDKGKSGTTFENREEFQKLRKAVESGPVFQAVICYDESRWGRAIDSEENTYWRVHFRKRGVEVMLVKTSVDPKNDFAPMLSAFEGVQASQYSKKLSELTLRGCKANGKYSRGGSAPYGYKRVAVNLKSGEERDLNPGDRCIRHQEKVRWELGDGHEIETVRFIFEQRVKGIAHVIIAKELNDKGVPCPKRGRWRNKNQKWSSATIKAIIENPAYYGAMVYNRNSMSSIIAQQEGKPLKPGIAYPHWTNEEEKWVIEVDAHPAIVDKNMWEKANATKRGTNANQRVKRESPYLLSGLVKCEKCGFNFQGQSTRAKGRPYYRYICGGYNNKRVCEYCAISRDDLEQFVIESVKKTYSHPDHLEEVRNIVEMLITQGGTDSVSQEKRLQNEIDQIDKKRENLLRAIEDGGNISALVSRLNELENEKNNFDIQLSDLKESTRKKIDPEAIVEAVSSFYRQFETDMRKAPQYLKKELMRMVVKEIGIDPETKVVHCYTRNIPTTNDEIPTEKPGFRIDRVAGVGLEPTTFGL